MLIIGKIIKPYGILGWLQIVSFTEKKEKIFEYSTLYFKTKKKYKKLKIKNWKICKKKILIKISKIEDRTKSEYFLKKKIFIKKCSLPKLKKNEYYWKDIINCKVFNTKNKFLGKITKIIDVKTSNIISIKTNCIKKKQEILIPFIINKYIKNININKKKIIIKNYLYFI
ncbi:ribosome maturation factor RimM [Buchnera aphidicola]|uniref:ribosome maturation factor RimM n=1 Tax=Buchnera aphidicola TaxID=9 RepID=UPI0031B880DC